MLYCICACTVVFAYCMFGSVRMLPHGIGGGSMGQWGLSPPNSYSNGGIAPIDFR